MHGQQFSNYGMQSESIPPPSTPQPASPPDCLVQGSSAAVIRQVFSMCIREVLVCHKCGTSSPEKPAEYDANVFYAYVSALREARAKDPECSFDMALKVCVVAGVEEVLLFCLSLLFFRVFHFCWCLYLCYC